jgi:hypothetical protein
MEEKRTNDEEERERQNKKREKKLWWVNRKGSSKQSLHVATDKLEMVYLKFYFGFLLLMRGANILILYLGKVHTEVFLVKQDVLYPR